MKRIKLLDIRKLVALNFQKRILPVHKKYPHVIHISAHQQAKSLAPTRTLGGCPNRHPQRDFSKWYAWNTDTISITCTVHPGENASKLPCPAEERRKARQGLIVDFLLGGLPVKGYSDQQSTLHKRDWIPAGMLLRTKSSTHEHPQCCYFSADAVFKISPSDSMPCPLDARQHNDKKELHISMFGFLSFW